jgi:hypothetical protein
MILTTHLDESGTHDGSPIAIMAGYVGTASQWKHFEADWAALVAKAGVRYIHAVDLFKRTQQLGVGSQKMSMPLRSRWTT